MPFKLDINNEPKYFPSMYSKDELPTWEELYRVYENKIFYFDPTNPDHQSKDLYWKYHHRKMLLIWTCNQLNKFLYEDENGNPTYMEEFLKWINENYTFDSNIDKVAFAISQITTGLCQSNRMSMFMDRMMENNPEFKVPPIYTCKLPRTHERSIFASNNMSIDIDELDDGFLTLEIFFRSGSQLYTLPRNTSYTKLYDAIEKIFSDHKVLEYYNDFVGWKNNDGSPLNRN